MPYIKYVILYILNKGSLVMIDENFITDVNRHKSREWSSEHIFDSFKVRAVLKDSEDLITSINNKSIIARRLTKDVGPEGESWVMEDNRNGQTEIYLDNTYVFVMWKLRKDETIEMIERIEQHKDD